MKGQTKSRSGCQVCKAKRVPTCPIILIALEADKNPSPSIAEV